MAGKVLASVRVYTRVPAPSRSERQELPEGRVRIRTHSGRPEDARIGVCWWMEVGREGDVKVGPPRLQHGPHVGSELFRLTLHKSGIRNLHGRTPTYERLTPTVPLRQVRGLQQSFAWVTPAVVNLKKPPRSETETAKVVTCPYPVSSVMLWVVEPGRPDLIEMLGHKDPLCFARVHVNWTAPHYVVEVYTEIPVEREDMYVGGQWLIPSVRADGAVDIQVLDENDPTAPGSGLSSFSHT